MTMTVAAMPSSEASSSPSKRAAPATGLRGPRPLPLKVSSSSSSRGSSPAPTTASTTTTKKPVIVYEHTPKVIHARPQEFMTVVQRLTGKPPATTTTSSSSLPTISPATAEEGGAGDPLLLTLGQRRAAPAPPTTATTTQLSSPMTAGTLLSPGIIFSPNTMQTIQELSPLF
ncbi:hypothetical protein Zm00014a_029638 [Zea mays]|uniref:VQ domain-containing protein n=2 Tax=Zea mays TaxID=4577 RepID=A0A1D6L704_MAIZE|nr:hypothetical protein ZEAMMB73_Zm00001d034379 [Zea mays]PWZ55933.1 hypothetical protein Zm00014a_029638 [Zea mays]|eukprot:XP_008666915.1 flocculation protein FLO11 [Zea mays]